MGTCDLDEIEKFNKLGEQWWNESGSMKMLHTLNPLRLKFIRDCANNHFSTNPKKSLHNLKILDIGCGGGILTEPMARIGGKVTGIDAGIQNIQVAKNHALAADLSIEYYDISIEDFYQKNKRKKFDIICALEIIEHVNDINLFFKTCAYLLKENGLLFISTLNRNLKSYALGIMMAEYVLKWLPKGTHDWKKFITPYELHQYLDANKIKIDTAKGFNFNPLSNKWSLSNDISVNYIICAKSLKK